MPCMTDEPPGYFKVITAREKLNELFGIKSTFWNTKYDKDKDYIAELCKICSRLKLSEIKENNLEEWYLDHLFNEDSRTDKKRVISEILRLYGEK